MNLTTPRIIETGIAIGLFLGYVILWRTKRVRELRRTGVDPEVLTHSVRKLIAIPHAALRW